MSALFGGWPIWQIRLGSFEVESPTTPKRRENHRGKACLLWADVALDICQSYIYEEAHRAALPLGPAEEVSGCYALALQWGPQEDVSSAALPSHLPFCCMRSDRGMIMKVTDAWPWAELKGKEDA